MEAVAAFAAAGRPVLGICNGFQVLTEAGLLPGVLMRNAALQFRSRWVHIRVERTETALQLIVRRGHGSGGRAHFDPCERELRPESDREREGIRRVAVHANRLRREREIGPIDAADHAFLQHPEHARGGCFRIVAAGVHTDGWMSQAGL